MSGVDPELLAAVRAELAIHGLEEELDAVLADHGTEGDDATRSPIVRLIGNLALDAKEERLDRAERSSERERAEGGSCG